MVERVSVSQGQYSGNKLVSANWTDIIVDYVLYANKIRLYVRYVCRIKLTLIVYILYIVIG